MDIKYRLYPHPVLWDKNDDYIGSIFDCEISLHRDIKRFKLDVNYNLDNEELHNLICNDQAEFILHIESPASSYRLVETSKSASNLIILNDEHLLGQVSLCPFIVAKQDIEKYYSKKFNDDYAGVTFEITKGTVLAIGNQQVFKVDKAIDDLSSVPSIFTIYKKETVEEMPMEIELLDNKIRVGLNIPDYENYYIHSQGYPNLVNAFIIYPALIYTFERLKEGFDDYVDYRWFRALEKMFNKTSQKFNKDLVDTYNSYELAQKVMVFPISKALSDINIKENDED